MIRNNWGGNIPDKNWQFELEEYIKQGEPLYIDMDIPFI